MSSASENNNDGVRPMSEQRLRASQVTPEKRLALDRGYASDSPAGNKRPKRRLDYTHDGSDISGPEEYSEDGVLDMTQPFEFTQDASAEDDVEDSVAGNSTVFVQDAFTHKVTTLHEVSNNISGSRTKVYSIGRNPDSSLLCHCPLIGRHQANLVLDEQDDSLWLDAVKNCWILKAKVWKEIPAGRQERIRDGDSFRLLPATKRSEAPKVAVQFSLRVLQKTNDHLTGSAAFDAAYISLLRKIQADGKAQSNKKGPNRTLAEPVELRINLGTEDDAENLLPITTLRKLFPKAAALEGVWYLRGEDHIEFLKRNQQKFWDAQARSDGWIGLNYGLLTNYPKPDHPNKSINQLEENVILPLCQNKSSRNMVCTLLKPGEDTMQKSCTSSIQFAVSNETLDLTVTQRSSDVVLGLPHDVIVWSIILQLVRREVLLRSQRKLKAGTLYFHIAAGGAHCYDINAGDMATLLDRKPIPNVNPLLVIDDTCGTKGMFELARTYDDDADKTVGVAKLRVAKYGIGSYHQMMKIKQALDQN